MKLEYKSEIILPKEHVLKIQEFKNYIEKKIIILNEDKQKEICGTLKKGNIQGYYHLLLENKEEYVFNIDEKLRFYLPNF